MDEQNTNYNNNYKTNEYDKLRTSNYNRYGHNNQSKLKSKNYYNKPSNYHYIRRFDNQKDNHGRKMNDRCTYYSGCGRSTQGSDYYGGYNYRNRFYRRLNQGNHGRHSNQSEINRYKNYSNEPWPSDYHYNRRYDNQKNIHTEKGYGHNNQSKINKHKNYSNEPSDYHYNRRYDSNGWYNNNGDHINYGI